MAIQCPSCGFENREVARFCRQCGTPLLLRRTIVTVTAKCISTNRPYDLVFERTGDGPWVLRRTEASMSSESTIDSEQFHLEEIAWDRAKANPCPYCANQALIQCGSCGRLSCHPRTEKGAMVKCAWCGVDGRVEDYIRQIEGKQRL